MPCRRVWRCRCRRAWARVDKAGAVIDAHRQRILCDQSQTHVLVGLLETTAMAWSAGHDLSSEQRVRLPKSTTPSLPSP